jgi:hypothetical protein
MLYPVPILKPRHSILKLGLGEMLSFWRSGLWVLGRVYRSLWNALMMPNVYRTPLLKPAMGGIERVRKRVFDASDRLVSRWAISNEEDFLRSINTHAQFIHFGKNIQFPLKKVGIFKGVK